MKSEMPETAGSPANRIAAFAARCGPARARGSFSTLKESGSEMTATDVRYTAADLTGRLRDFVNLSPRGVAVRGRIRIHREDAGCLHHRGDQAPRGGPREGGTSRARSSRSPVASARQDEESAARRRSRPPSADRHRHRSLTRVLRRCSRRCAAAPSRLWFHSAYRLPLGRHRGQHRHRLPPRQPRAVLPVARARGSQLGHPSSRRPVSYEDLGRVHTPDYLEALSSPADPGPHLRGRPVGHRRRRAAALRFVSPAGPPSRPPSAPS